MEVAGNITSWSVQNALPGGSYTIWFKMLGAYSIDNAGPGVKTRNSLDFLEEANVYNIVNILVSPSGEIKWSVVDHADIDS